MRVGTIQWTYWKDGMPQHESKVHLIDDENNWKREGAVTLCGTPVGFDSMAGDRMGDYCRRCYAIAERRNLEVEF